MLVQLGTQPAGFSPQERQSRHSPPLWQEFRDSRIALVSLPFVSVAKPSIQLGLLKAIARSRGFQVTNFDLSLDFARQIGPDVYAILANHRGHLFGDWLFSRAAFGRDAPDLENHLLSDLSIGIATVLAPLGEHPGECLRKLREFEVPRYLDLLMEIIPWSDFRVVGFTSTFQQNTASFALAARIKKRYPGVCTLFGGANFDGEMGLELVRTVGCIDYAVIGEGDEAFPEFLAALLEGRDPSEVPGVVCRRDGSVTDLRARSPFEKMDDLPVPDYEDFFERAETLGLLTRSTRRQVGLPFESSRGCWWGKKHHCTFCGLNGNGMTFRAKSPARLQDELAELSRRYRTFKFEAVDNILSMSYLEDFLPGLVRDGYNYALFYETKSNLRREQVRLLSEAGVRCIQPGIESLSSHVLELMRKGVTAVQNVNLLRWASYYGICVVWNIIWGFPGETQEDYGRQIELIPHLLHLQPPLSTSRIWMERFSPIFSDRERFPARSIRAEASYSYVYPEFVDRDRVAYFFDYELESTLPDSVYEPVARRAQIWQQAWQGRAQPRLTFRSSREFLQIEDRRNCFEAFTYTLTGPVASLYAGCSDNPQSSTALRKKLGLDWPEDKIERAMDELCRQGLMMRDASLFLSLALPASPGNSLQRSAQTS